MSIKNDGHYFCRAGGNRPDGLNEPVTHFINFHLKYELDIFIHKNYSSTAYRGGYVKPLISLKTKTNFQIYYLTNE
ncbi:hypothetical protein FNW97_15480 [Escherichia coli]|nr:hypothetical protein FNW97_15480 [Escherichia coli]